MANLSRSEPQGRNKLRVGLEAALVVTVALLLGYLWQDRHGTTDEIRAVQSRSPALGLELPEVDGGVWKLREHRGEVVLVNFWATWCPPCRQETPGLVKLARHYQGKGLAVVGISLDEGGADEVRKFIKDFKVPYPMAFPPSDSALAGAVQSIPTTLLLDREGRIARTYQGAVRESVFRGDIDRLLAEAASAKPKQSS